MPTYEHRCNKCGDHFELFQSFSEDPVKKHGGACGGRVLRVLSPVGIVFSGSGFYKTDSRAGGNGNGKRGRTSESSESSESSSSSSSGSSESGSSSSESKPTESKPSNSKSSDSKKTENKKSA